MLVSAPPVNDSSARCTNLQTYFRRFYRLPLTDRPQGASLSELALRMTEQFPFSFPVSPPPPPPLPRPQIRAPGPTGRFSREPSRHAISTGKTATYSTLSTTTSTPTTVTMTTLKFALWLSRLAPVARWAARPETDVCLTRLFVLRSL